VSERLLVVNADDFGLSPGVNAGILRGHAEGIVTSTSLMVERAAAAEAVEAARAHPRLSVGLHVDLGEWVFRGGRWEAGHEVADLTDPAAVEAAIHGQLERFRTIAGRDPSHLDSHQHVHREQPVAGVLLRIAEQLAIPLRDTAGGIPYRGEFYGQTGKGEPYPEGITAEALVAAIERLPDGVHELGCHPAETDDSGSTYGAERTRELEALCSPRARAALDRCRIHLISFAELEL
jgi:chitin disaccharide deacetylase